MKTKLFFSFLLLASTLALHAQTLSVDGVVYNVDTLQNQQVGPGTQYTALRLTASKKQLDVFFLKTDLKNPHIEIRTALGRDSIYGGERPSVLAKRISSENNRYFAGTNGDFYVTSGPYVAYPVSGNMVNGEIARIPENRNVFTIDDQKRPDIGIMAYNGSIKFGTHTWTIHSVNHLRNENRLVLFNRHNGKYTHTNAHGTEVLIELLNGHTWGSNKTLKAKVLKKETGKGNMAIPQGKAVLSGHGTAAEALNLLSENDEIEVRLNLSINENSTANFLQMTGGDNYATMLKDGVIEQSSVWNQLHPRTGLGYSQHRDTLIFCVIDGRGVSNGATTKQLAYLMKSAGAWTAFNMDGGGSSCMYIEGYGGPVNNTSDGSERAVSNSVFVVSTAPTDNQVSLIKPQTATIQLPRFGVFKPKFMAYNRYGTLLNIDLPGVTLTCTPDMGYINTNGEFVASGTSNGVLTASYQGITATVNVEVMSNSTFSLRLKRLVIDDRREYPIEVLSTVGNYSMVVLPDAFTWVSKDPSVCTANNGVIKALANGVTYVVGSFENFKDSIRVSVEIPESGKTLFDNFSSLDKWKVGGSGANVTLSNTNLPSGWNEGVVANYLFQGGPGPSIVLSNATSLFGMPDTLKVRLNIQNALLNKTTVTVKAPNSSVGVKKEITSLPANADSEIVITFDEFFNTKDMAVYPISFQNITFALSPHPTGQTYSLAIRDITLYYKGYEITYLPEDTLPDFAVYPNPTTHLLHIRHNTQAPYPQEVRLYALSGELMKVWRFSASLSNELTLSMDDVPAGTYTLSLSNGQRPPAIAKVVKH